MKSSPTFPNSARPPLLSVGLAAFALLLQFAFPLAHGWQERAGAAQASVPAPAGGSVAVEAHTASQLLAVLSHRIEGRDRDGGDDHNRPGTPQHPHDESQCAAWQTYAAARAYAVELPPPSVRATLVAIAPRPPTLACPVLTAPTGPASPRGPPTLA